MDWRESRPLTSCVSCGVRTANTTRDHPRRNSGILLIRLLSGQLSPTGYDLRTIPACSRRHQAGRFPGETRGSLDFLKWAQIRDVWRSPANQAITARLGTGSCSNTITCQANSKRSWRNSSTSPTAGATTRASASNSRRLSTLRAIQALPHEGKTSKNHCRPPSCPSHIQAVVTD
jgi:hypothetical protein